MSDNQTTSKGNSSPTATKGGNYGPNSWVIDEMYRRYSEEPEALPESWQDFFRDYQPPLPATKPATQSVTPPHQPPSPVKRQTNGASTKPPAAPTSPAKPHSPAPRAAASPPVPAAKPTASPAAPATKATQPEPELLRGVAARIVTNMEASLTVPTATSLRTLPAKVLEENRRLINEFLATSRGGKVSFTHVIGWAIVKAAAKVPAMNAAFTEVDSKPAKISHTDLNLGLAVDIAKPDGSRSLVVPNIKGANHVDFAGFHATYEEVLRKVKTNKLTPDDFAGSTMTLTNPGTIGTASSTPRLMPGQGVIIGVGSLAWPPEFKGTDPLALADLGVSKIMTVTSTYDHRIIQGAESGEFLRWVEQLLLGDENFYDEIFASLGMAIEPLRWKADSHAPTTVTGVDAGAEKAGRVLQLINMYRVRGHLLADVNPLDVKIRSHVELDPAYYGLSVWDLDRPFFTGGLGDRDVATLREIIDQLRASYCRKTGYEYMHIQDPEQKRWIQERVEVPAPELSSEDKHHLLSQLNAAEAFEQFLATKYVGHKRFGIDGGESIIPMLDALLSDAADHGVEDAIIGMTHRGRLNVLVNIMGKTYRQIFSEFEGDISPDTVQGSGDVKYHLGFEGKHTTRQNSVINLTLAPNPSHLEAANPVVEGMARAKESMLGPDGHFKVLPILLHGDAAFAGQGVVAETLNLSQLPGYRTGGTVHLVINNGIGFTTDPEDARSSHYATDVAKMVQAPIIHVNGDDPEACLRAVRLAFEYRQTFTRDVVIDMVCYRRFGHNEADEPSYTQPHMYAQIQKHRSVRKLYTEQLVNKGDITVEDAQEALEEFHKIMQTALDETRQASSGDVIAHQAAPARGVLPAVDTSIDRATLDQVATALTTVPDGFNPHAKIAKLLQDRGQQFSKNAVDWGMAESLAFGSLLLNGVTIRLSGQDSRRGTFSHRHSSVIDIDTEQEYMPLRALESPGVQFRVYDSFLSEYAVLGFEYGVSVERPDALVLWEAQFGDFSNGAQIIIDQFITAGEGKWKQTSGLVMLLPHGYEGQGPEHSSARLERYLTMCAEDNVQVAYPTTAAQHFHLLRRQMVRDVRKPLIVMTPKSLLRLPDAKSPVTDFTDGGFQEVITDQGNLDPQSVTSVLLCSGKVYYDLVKYRTEHNRNDVAIARVEQLYPLPCTQIRQEIDKYPNVTDVCWVQEEPDNMGALSFVKVREHRYLPDGFRLRHSSRNGAGSPAAGSAKVHAQEQAQLTREAFAAS